MAGNHGDEYEGQIIVSQLMREIGLEMVSGQLILLPMANFPAADAGLRVSPLDEGNLNRSFGDPTGTPTQMIAHYIEHALLSRAEYLVDLHSGGSSLLYQAATCSRSIRSTPTKPRSSTGCWSRSAAQCAAACAESRAFGVGRAPAGRDLDRDRTRRRGHGRSVADPDGPPRAAALLGHIGSLRGALVPDAPPTVTRFMRVDGERHFVYAYERGLYEPLVELGDRRKAGQPAAWVHFPDNAARAGAAPLQG